MKPAFTSTHRRLDNRHRIALPRQVLRTLDLRRGDYVVFRVVAGEVQLHKCTFNIANRGCQTRLHP